MKDAGIFPEHTRGPEAFSLADCFGARNFNPLDLLTKSQSNAD